MSDGKMLYFRDSSKPEDYWSDSQWKMYQTMKDMDILPASDRLVPPAHIGDMVSKDDEDGGLKGSAPFFASSGRSGPGFQETDGAGAGIRPQVEAAPADKRWDDAAKSMRQYTVPSLATASPSGSEGDVSDAKADSAYMPGMYKRFSGTKPPEESFSAGLRLDGRDDADRWQAAEDLNALPGARAAGYVMQGINSGVLEVGSRVVDPFIHIRNISRSDYTPEERLLPSEHARVDGQNAGAVRSLGEMSEGLKEAEKRGIKEDTDFYKQETPTLLGAAVNKGKMAASMAAPALMNTFGGRVWNAYSRASGAVSAGLKTYNDRMLAYRGISDEAVCDPVINPIFGSICRQRVNAGENPRDVAMEMRQNMAVLHALKEAGITVAADELKRWAARVAGQSGEGPMVQYSQNLFLELLDNRIQDIRLEYGEAAARKGQQVLEAISAGMEWHMRNY